MSRVTVLEMGHSPFCIPITRALKACGVKVDHEEIPNWDRSRVAEITGGQYYQVPVLIHGDAVVYETGPDSQDIAHYVDQHFAGGKLFPAALDGLQQILIAFLENDLESITFRLVDPPYMDTLDPIARCLVIRHKERKFGSGCVEQWRQQRAKLTAQTESHLLKFESMLQSHPFLLGEAPVYTDFLLYGILGNLTWKGLNDLPASCPALQDWYSRMEIFNFSQQ